MLTLVVCRLLTLQFQKLGRLQQNLYHLEHQQFSIWFLLRLEVFGLTLVIPHVARPAYFVSTEWVVYQATRSSL